MKAEVYLFDEVPKDDINRNVLGGKGYSLVEMTSIGLPVPPGIVITTRMCKEFYEKDRKIWPELKAEILAKVSLLEKRTGKKFNDAEKPLLISVRSGSAMSMPGMMDTVLNLGINDNIVKYLIAKTGDERFAYDTYRRFIQLFGKIVLGIPGEKFDQILEKVKEETGAKSDVDVKAEAWREVVKRYRDLIKKETGKDIPQDPIEQLLLSVAAVFGSWWNKRAVEYRKIYKISDSLGTAVNMQMMIFGNLDDNSGTGVGFTRNPATGENKLYGEFLMKAQGEDIVSGIRTPIPTEKMKETMPTIYKQLESTAKKIETHFRDMQDFEFTIESGKFYMLQCRPGKRTAKAAVEIAIDLANEGLITKEEALLRVEPDQLTNLIHKQIDPKAKATSIAKGLPASPGASSGKVVFTNEEAQEARQKGEKIILVRPETMPEDIVGIASSDGVLTSRGGMTCHAALVTRGMGKPCIVGAESIKVSIAEKKFTVNGKTIKGGDVITIDGGSGNVYLGEMPMIDPGVKGQVATILKWADGFRKMGVRANADTPEMASKAKENGAEGIGLVRTERMFVSPETLELVQKMVLADTLEERKKYLDRIEPMQKKDFKELFKIMGDLPVTIRLLDMPLHEFLPKLEEILPKVAELRLSGKKAEELKEKEIMLKKVLDLKEYNPMMGQRGVRLALTNNEIYQMQVRAIFEAATELQKEKGKAPEVEVMVSQVAEAEELKKARAIIEKEAEEVMKTHGVRIKYRIGSMIETPRAALTAMELAEYSDFFSFGTNDLTQATYAFSRDDVEAKFMPFYLDEKVLKFNPFETIDGSGVGRLVRIGVEEGRSAKKLLKIGVCGELGGDPASIEFFNGVGLDYVSCSPFRVPVARLAAAQAELKKKSHKGSSTV